ncbi:hypothetical protein ACE6H2_026953 [Prunus campanulata]
MNSSNYDISVSQLWVDVKLFALSIFPPCEYLLASVYGSDTENNLTSIIIDNLVTIEQFCLESNYVSLKNIVRWWGKPNLFWLQMKKAFPCELAVEAWNW